MATQKKIVKAGGAAPDQLEDKVAAELLNLEVGVCSFTQCVCCGGGVLSSAPWQRRLLGTCGRDETWLG